MLAFIRPKTMGIVLFLWQISLAGCVTPVGSSARIMPDAGLLETASASAPNAATPEEAEFEVYQRTYRRNYEHDSKEYWLRRRLFEKRSAEVKAHNARRDRLWEAVAGRFADYTEEERASLRGYKHKLSPRRGGIELPPEVVAERELLRPILNNATLPAEFNWMNLTVAKHVPDQLQCGSCWAVAAKSVLDAHHEIYVGTVRNFSAQQIISCAPDPRHCGGKGKCEGSTVELAFDWVLHQGCATEEDVPYLGKDLTEADAKCNASGSLSGKPHSFVGAASSNGQGSTVMAGAYFGMFGYKMLERNKKQELMENLYQHGPVATSACANTWFEYRRGIVDSCHSSCIVDHAVTLYGYGEASVKVHQPSHSDDFQVLEADSRQHLEQTTFKKYWLIRNSWGPDWGEKGFVRLLRYDKEGEHCGEDRDNSQGTGCDGDPKVVEVCGMCGFLWDSVVPHFHQPSSSNSFSQADVSEQASVQLLRRESPGLPI